MACRAYGGPVAGTATAAGAAATTGVSGIPPPVPDCCRALPGDDRS